MNFSWWDLLQNKWDGMEKVTILLIIDLMMCRRRVEEIYKEKKEQKKEIKIPSEMEVAPPPKLVTLFTLFALLTLLAPLTLLRQLRLLSLLPPLLVL